MHSKQARSAFLKFFEENGHTVVPSSSLVPADASVMFTIAGMIQFAPYFLGTAVPPFARATSVQKCLRAGGKQNDLEEVGISPRHHTFFEMLGNFSFGDYFKSDACRFAWDLSTGVYGLDPDRIWVSVFEEDEVADVWTKEIGIDPSRVARFGRDENFWSMGGAGPCGYISELFYDFGPDFGDEHPTGPLGGDENRYQEYYNLVFMEFVQNEDSEIVGKLDRPGVDTGMGFERMLSMLQGVGSNYETDVFEPIIAAGEKVTGAKRDGTDIELRFLRILADHARAMTFLVADGVLPSNEGRGYVLRRIMRRAITKARLAGINISLLAPMSEAVVAQFSDVYPEVLRHAQSVSEVATREEDRFSRTLDAGLGLLLDEIKTTKTELSGEVAFRLYDTYGFPLEITQEVAADASITVDVNAFNELMTEQRDRSRGDRRDSKVKLDASDDWVSTLPPTSFSGYGELKDSATVVALVASASVLHEGAAADVVVSSTVFYPEGGGQIGDVGFIHSASARARVVGTQRRGAVIIHSVVVEGGDLKVGDEVSLEVDPVRRVAAERAHTATHILHFHLRDVLGDHVRQMGSLVEPGRLRFDFAHFDALGADTLIEIEEKVNASVVASDSVKTFETSYREAIDDLNATAFFEEKYGDVVRVVDIGGYSRELCGGTHVATTGSVGFVKLTGEGSIGANIRRVEALCGIDSVRWLNERLREASRAAEILKIHPSVLSEGAQRLAQTSKDLAKRVAEMERGQASELARELLESVEVIDGAKIICKLCDVDVSVLRELAMNLRDRADAVVLGRVDSNGANIIIASLKIDSRDALATAAALIGGKAGGKPNLAMCGGRNVEAMDVALAAARQSASTLVSSK